MMIISNQKRLNCHHSVNWQRSEQIELQTVLRGYSLTGGSSLVAVLPFGWPQSPTPSRLKLSLHSENHPQHVTLTCCYRHLSHIITPPCAPTRASHTGRQPHLKTEKFRQYSHGATETTTRTIINLLAPYISLISFARGKSHNLDQEARGGFNTSKDLTRIFINTNSVINSMSSHRDCHLYWRVMPRTWSNWSNIIQGFITCNVLRQSSAAVHLLGYPVLTLLFWTNGSGGLVGSFTHKKC